MPKTGFLNKMGSLLYGNVEGVLDTVSFGLTDTMTDKLWENTLNKKGAKNLNQFRGAGNIAGAVGGGILTGNVSGAINEGLEGFGDIAGNSQNADFQKAEKFAQLGAQIASFLPNSGSLTNFGSKMANVTSNPMVSGTMGQLNSFVGQSASQPKQISANVPKDVVYSRKQDTNFADGGEVATPQMPKILQSLKNKNKQFEDGGEVDDPTKPGLSPTYILPMNPQQVQQMIRQNQQPQLTAQQLMMQRLAADNARRANTVDNTKTTQQQFTPEERANAIPQQSGLLQAADIATDVMQLGNFIPLPPAQFIGRLGNYLGTSIDAYQLGREFFRGPNINYGNVASNALGIALPYYFNKSGYLRDMYNTTPGSVADRIASFGSRDGSYRHLTPKPNLKGNPVIKKGVNANRKSLGMLLGETVLDAYKKGGMIKRADGSYSKRGLWDNIRANRGSGKKPTAEMLKQERKIKRNS